MSFDPYTAASDPYINDPEDPNNNLNTNPVQYQSDQYDDGSGADVNQYPSDYPVAVADDYQSQPVDSFAIPIPDEANGTFPEAQFPEPIQQQQQQQQQQEEEEEYNNNQLEDQVYAGAADSGAYVDALLDGGEDEYNPQAEMADQYQDPYQQQQQQQMQMQIQMQQKYVDQTVSDAAEQYQEVVAPLYEAAQSSAEAVIAPAPVAASPQRGSILGRQGSQLGSTHSVGSSHSTHSLIGPRGSVVGQPRSSLISKQVKSQRRSSIAPALGFIGRRRSSISLIDQDKAQLTVKPHVDPHRPILQVDHSYLYHYPGTSGSAPVPHDPSSSQLVGAGNTANSSQSHPHHGFNLLSSLHSIGHRQSTKDSHAAGAAATSGAPSAFTKRVQNGYYFQPKYRLLMDEMNSNATNLNSNHSYPALHYVIGNKDTDRIYFVRKAAAHHIETIRRDSLIGAKHLDPAQLAQILKMAAARKGSNAVAGLGVSGGMEMKEMKLGIDTGDDGARGDEEDDADAESDEDDGMAARPAGLREFVCCICATADLVEPWISECGHVCCAECWQTWLNENQSHTCPECNAPVDLENLRPVSLCLICNNLPTDPWTSPCRHTCCAECWKNYLRETPQCPQCNATVNKDEIP